MCRVGGPRCSDKHLPVEERKTLYQERIKEHIHSLESLDTETDSYSYDETLNALYRTQRSLDLLDGKETSIQHEDWSTILTTIKQPDGGFTIGYDTLISPVRGFCVSPYPQRCQVFDTSEDLTPQDIMTFFENNNDLLKKKDHYIGGWNDPETGKVYLDVSIVTQNSHRARTICEQSDQIAFFDLQRFESVTVNQNASSGQ